LARYDKYDSENGGFRAVLAASLTLVSGGVGPVGVSLDANGRVLVGGPNNSGIIGILVKNMPGQAMVGNALLPQLTAPGSLAGDVVDIMTHGEIVDIAGLVAGTNYFLDGVTGVLTAGTGAGTATGPVTAGTKKAGWTVEATRLVVRMQGS
jgi:hypothetical protein